MSAPQGKLYALLRGVTYGDGTSGPGVLRVEFDAQALDDYRRQNPFTGDFETFLLWVANCRYEATIAAFKSHHISLRQFRRAPQN